MRQFIFALTGATLLLAGCARDYDLGPLADGGCDPQVDPSCTALTAEDGGPCSGVVCESAPPSVCLDTNTIRTYPARGVCAQGQCQYRELVLDCQQGCVDNKCVGEPCIGVRCLEPPVARCADATQLVTYSSPGTCSEGECKYSETVTTCPGGCADGKCLADPCAGVACTQPPATSCLNATTLRSFASSGTCSQGTCSYAPSDTTCPFGCLNGACANDPCTGVTCNQPPAAYCVDSTTRRGWTVPGACAAGNCTYAPSDVTCPFGCANGSCVNDPCVGVTCATPPAAYCLNASTRRGFQNPGSCTGGSCTYVPVDTPCAHGCQNGQCIADPCTGVTCNSPPSVCYAAAGTCSNGTCHYPFDNSATCSDGDACTVNDRCTNGMCAGEAKTCTTPPAEVCGDATTLRIYQGVGTCSAGTCGYAYSEYACAYGCAAGKCNPNPCNGIVCQSPPSPTCTNPNTLRTFGAGSCNGGSCHYAYVEENCSGGCSNGACNAPTCGATSCNAPPAPTCISSTTLKTYAKLGRCNGTSCQYQSMEVFCGQGCLNGACLPGSWTNELLPLPSGFTPFELAADAVGRLYVVGTNSAKDIVFRWKDDYGWAEEVVDPGMGAQTTVALTLDAQGVPAVAYYDSTNKDLRFAKRVGGGWARELVANAGTVGLGASLTFDTHNEPAIAFYRQAPNELQVARRSGATWNIATVASHSAGASPRTAIRLDPAGNLVVVGGVGEYITKQYPSKRGVVLYATLQGPSWTTTELTPTGLLGARPLGFRPDGSTLVAYLIPESGGQKVLVDRFHHGQHTREWATHGSWYAWSGQVLARLDGEQRPELLFRDQTPQNPHRWMQRHEGGHWDEASAPTLSSVTYQDLNWGPDRRYRKLLTTQAGIAVLTMPLCTPHCTGRSCGDDGCGGTCGTGCGPNQFCAVNGTCSAWRFQHLPQSNPAGQAWVRIGGDRSTVHAVSEGGYWQQAAGQWKELPAGTFEGFDYAVSFHDGTPYRAMWNNNVLSVSKWNQSWVPVGPTASYGYHVWPVLDVGPSGQPHLLTMSNNACGPVNGPLDLVHWQLGSAWSSQTIMTKPQGCQFLSQAALKVDASGASHVAWADNPSSGGRGLFYLTNRGGSWVRQTIVGSADTIAFNPRLAVDSAGAPHLFYRVAGKDWFYATRSGNAWSSEKLAPGMSATTPTLSKQGRVLALLRDANSALFLGERLGPNNWQLEAVPTYTASDYADLFVDADGGVHLLVRDGFTLLYGYRQ